MSAKMKNITGQRFGRLTALKPGRKDNYGKFFWKCLCDCGNICTIRGTELRSGNSKSCGCLQKELASKLLLKNLTGRRFGRLLVLGLEQKRTNNGKAIHRCQCDCGKIVIVSSANLQGGSTKSCGCLAVAFNFVRGTDINPMDIPIKVIKCLRTHYKLRKAIKQAS